MVLMPWRWASAGEVGLKSRPSKVSDPSSRGWTPVRTLISVDLPAPFWPIRAWTSPARTSKSTPASEWTPGKRLWIPRATRSGSVLTGADHLRGRGLVEQLVLALDVLGHLLAGAHLGDGVVDLGPEQRVALDGGVQLARDHGLEGALHPVH